MNATKLTAACAIIDTVLIVYINEIEEELHFLSTIIKWKKKLSRVYYSPKGFWKGLPAVKKLAKEARVSADNERL